MTKETLIELVIARLAAEVADKKTQYSQQEIEKYVEIVYNSVINSVCVSAISQQDYSALDSYIKAYKNVSVTCDTDRDEWYSTLPASIIQLPSNRGIVSISPMKDRKISFIYRRNGASEIYENLEVGLINTTPTFYVENSDIFYCSRMDSDLAEEGVLMKLIVPFDEFDDDEEITLPGGKDFDIVGLVVEAILGKQKNDIQQNKRPDDMELKQ